MELSFILVEPAVPQNIGASARALKTMGFTDLRLVNPRGHHSDKARWLAHGSVDILEKSSVFHSLEEAIGDLDFVIGTTAKDRSVKEDYYPPEEAREILRQKGKTIEKAGLVFGREESGLTNTELRLCDIASTIPLVAPYPSVNLAQSVMIYAYVFSSVLAGQRNKKQNNAQNERTYHELRARAMEIMQQYGIDRNPNLYHRILERIAVASDDDTRLMLSFIKHLKQKFD